MSLGHEIDVPVTNLDEEDDDFSTPSEEELDAGIFRDDFGLEDRSPFGKTSLMDKIKSSISRFTSKGYNPVNMPSLNGIELQPTRFNDADSFDLSDDEFINRPPKLGFFKTIGGFFKKFFLHMMLVSLIIVVIVLLVLLFQKPSSNSKSHVKHLLSNGTDLFYPTTILISLDGFHPHYISSELTPTLHDFLKNGYGPPYMIPSFPSSTFPNHWTMATGLYPQAHGIVGNTFHDPLSDKQFINVIPEKSLDPYWWGGEPIWSTAEYQNVRSAIHMYPGSEVKFPNGNPTEVDKFNQSETLEVKSDRIFQWLDRDVSERPELIISYVPTIDSLGHHYGIKGDELQKGLKYVDSFIKNLTEGIENRNASDLINLVVVSDHGMAPTSNDRLIYLDDLVNITKIQYTDGWPLFGLRPFEDVSIEEIYEELNFTYKDNSGYKFYYREELPKEWNFGGPKRSEFYDRIAPLWVVPDIGYAITTHDDMERKGGDYTPKGVHGYNNTEVLMRAIFLGTGPYFKSRSKNDESFKVRPFQNTEVYNILCETLNLSPAVNNGTTNVISQSNKLDANWRDDTSYPDVAFDVGGILEMDSTYEQLFRGEKLRATTTLKPTTDAESEAIVSTSAKASSTNKDSKSSEPSPVSTKSENTKEIKTTTEAESEMATETPTKENGKHKGFFEKIGEELSDIGEDIKEGFEDVADDVEDAFEDAYHKVTGEEDDD